MASSRGFVATIRDLQERHRRFVKKVHAFRIPLSPTGRRIASFIYFTIPIIGGFYIMDWAMNKSREELGWQDDDGRSPQSSTSSLSSPPSDDAVVFQAMKIDPSQRQGERSQIDLQNQRLQSFLAHLKEK